MSEEKKNETKPNYYKVLLYVIIVLIPIIVWFYSIEYVSTQVGTPKDIKALWTIRGQFGDSFGAVNALFSGLAFAGIIITILMQHEELGLQREDLALTRKELEETRKEFEQQNTTLKRQRFESTFYNMLSIHFQLLHSVQYLSTQGYGIHALTAFTQESLSYCKGTDLEIDKAYSTYYNSDFTNKSSHYIQSLIALHTAIKDSRFKPKAEKRYLDMLKAYISIPERRFLYYHILLGYNIGLLKLERDLNIVKEFPTALLLQPNDYLLQGKFKKKLSEFDN